MERVAILADYLVEGWASMDLYASTLMEHLAHSRRFAPVLIRPEFRDRLSQLPWLFGPRHGRTLDRYWNRYVDYPRHAARCSDVRLFHVTDQTYAHLVSALPPGRTVVTCHDLDFASPPAGTRQAWLVRATGAWTLRGLQRASRVICDSEVVRDEIVRRGLLPPERLTVVPLGVEEEFSPEGARQLSEPAESLLAPFAGAPLLLHVGAMIPRKRLDLVLHSFARVRDSVPGAVLVRVGGALSAAMTELARHLGIEQAIVSMPFLTRSDLAALYRRADVFVLASDQEGFGLPVIEAMATGLPVVAREIPTVREVAGDAIEHVAGDSPEALAAAVIRLLADGTRRAIMREAGIDRARRYRWEHTAAATAHVYDELLRDSSRDGLLPSGERRP